MRVRVLLHVRMCASACARACTRVSSVHMLLSIHMLSCLCGMLLCIWLISYLDPCVVVCVVCDCVYGLYRTWIHVWLCVCVLYI
jgi:hypothetical protein